MLILGLTGGIACGKSTVACIFKGLGAEVIDADEIAREVVRPGTSAWKGLVDYFGKDILSKDLSINRKKLGKIVFASVRKRHKLEEIVHPSVIKTIKEKIKELSTVNCQPSTVVVDAPLLIEANLTSLVDKLVVVSAWRRIQMRRLQESGLEESEAVKRIDAQMSLEKKTGLADYVIRNNGSLKEMERRVKRVWKDIRKADI
ncbi:dephospho-CoA kinase [candidate division NPL-UPA2 bacterium]|nr:dephospho-CoA kinase [candidate division NPL-UPA2 bacterium]